MLLIGCRASAHAQEVSLQTQFAYTLSETGLADGSVRSNGQFSPWYVLTLRGPLIGGTDTQVELGLTGYETGNPETSVDQRNYRLSLFAKDERLTLVATAIRDVSRLTAARPGGGDRTSLAVADAYSVNGVLAYPSYPRLSFQYQRTTFPVSDGPKRESTNRALGVRHDWGPLQLIADHVRQESVFSGTVSESRRYGVSLDRSLLPTVRLRIDHHSDVSTATQRNRERTTLNQITTARVSALPTPFLVFDGELSYSQAENQGAGVVGGAESSGWGHSYHLRSEVLPGLRLDLARNGQEYRSSYGSTSWTQTSANIGVRPHPTTALLAHWSRATAVDPITPANADMDRRISLTTDISPRTALSAEYGVTSQAYREGRRDTTGTSLGIRGYVSPMLSVGASVRQERLRTRVGQAISINAWRSLDLNAAWLPSDLWHLGVGLGIAQARGSQRSSSVIPHFDVRWDVDPATMVTLRYYAQRTRQGDGAFAPGNRSLGLTGSLTHRLPNTGVLELTYEYRRAASSVFTWERVLELRHTREF